MKTAKQILQEAKSAPHKGDLQQHIETIDMLRTKGYSWRDIASFLNERGVETDHTKIYRFIKKQRNTKMDPCKDFFVPSYTEYYDALKNIQDNITEKQKIMLGCHFKAHNRTVTFGELASAADYDDYSSANLQYGLLGTALGEELNMVFAKMDESEDSKPFRTSSLASTYSFRQQGQEFQIIMHHELAKALRKLGWFN